MGEMWNALSDAERLPYERAAKEATRLQYERAVKSPVSDPTLGSLTAAPTTTVSTRSSAEIYDALLLAQLFDHASRLRFVSEFLDRALENMTEEEAVEVMLRRATAGKSPTAHIERARSLKRRALFSMLWMRTVSRVI